MLGVGLLRTVENIRVEQGEEVANKYLQKEVEGFFEKEDSFWHRLFARSGSEKDIQFRGSHDKKKWKAEEIGSEILGTKKLDAVFPLMPKGGPEIASLRQGLTLWGKIHDAQNKDGVTLV